MITEIEMKMIADTSMKIVTGASGSKKTTFFLNALNARFCNTTNAQCLYLRIIPTSMKCDLITNGKYAIMPNFSYYYTDEHVAENITCLDKTIYPTGSSIVYAACYGNYVTEFMTVYRSLIGYRKTTTKDQYCIVIDELHYIEDIYPSILDSFDGEVYGLTLPAETFDSIEHRSVRNMLCYLPDGYTEYSIEEVAGQLTRDLPWGTSIEILRLSRDEICNICFACFNSSVRRFSNTQGTLNSHKLTIESKSSYVPVCSECAEHKSLRSFFLFPSPGYIDCVTGMTVN